MRGVALSRSVPSRAGALGVSWDFWAAYIAGEIPTVRRGRRKLIPVRELERWLDENSTLPLDRNGGR